MRSTEYCIERRIHCHRAQRPHKETVHVSLWLGLAPSIWQSRSGALWLADQLVGVLTSHTRSVFLQVPDLRVATRELPSGESHTDLVTDEALGVTRGRRRQDDKGRLRICDAHLVQLDNRVFFVLYDAQRVDLKVSDPGAAGWDYGVLEVLPEFNSCMYRLLVC